MELNTYTIVNIYALIIGMIYGLIAQKKQFCFSGAIKDYILFKSTKRASSIIMAMIIAIVSTYIVSSYYSIDLSTTYYYKQNINYFAIILGGALFGIGIMIADGCSSRHLIKFSQGDKYSLISLVFIGIFAYLSTKGFLYTYVEEFINNKTLVYYSSFIPNIKLNIYLTLLILIILLLILVKKPKRILTLKDGFIVGVLIAVAWAVTGVIGVFSDKIINLSSITFVYPSSQTLEYIISFGNTTLSFPICIIFGVIIGSFIMSRFNKKYSLKCASTSSKKKIYNSIIGGSLMGLGGIFSLGCTVGQGLSGFSTLAFASLIAIISIFIFAYITAIILNKKGSLPMCFIFEWDDKK